MFRKSFAMFQIHSRRLLSSKRPSGIDWIKQEKRIERQRTQKTMEVIHKKTKEYILKEQEYFLKDFFLEKILMEPFEHIRRVPCKHYSLIVAAFNHWLKIPEKKLDEIQEAALTTCVWGALIDDIQDNSAFRYGVPSAHRVYSVALTLNAADLGLLQGENQVIAWGHPLAWKIFSKRITEYLQGQGSDIYWRDNQLWPTEEEYLDMAKRKIGSFYAFPIELMQLFSRSDKDYSGLAINIGIYYCIIDDYYNLFQPNAMESMAMFKQVNFTANSDITESKITLPIIHAAQFPDVASELADILKQRTNDPKLKTRVISLLKKHGSDEYMKDMLRRLESSIRMEALFKAIAREAFTTGCYDADEINELGGNESLVAAMDDLSFKFHQLEDQKEYSQKC